MRLISRWRALMVVRTRRNVRLLSSALSNDLQVLVQSLRFPSIQRHQFWHKPANLPLGPSIFKIQVLPLVQYHRQVQKTPGNQRVRRKKLRLFSGLQPTKILERKNGSLHSEVYLGGLAVILEIQQKLNWRRRRRRICCNLHPSQARQHSSQCSNINSNSRGIAICLLYLETHLRRSLENLVVHNLLADITLPRVSIVHQPLEFLPIIPVDNTVPAS